MVFCRAHTVTQVSVRVVVLSRAHAVTQSGWPYVHDLVVGSRVHKSQGNGRAFGAQSGAQIFGELAAF